jgi:hypothetical protein
LHPISKRAFFLFENETALGAKRGQVGIIDLLIGEKAIAALMSDRFFVWSIC